MNIEVLEDKDLTNKEREALIDFEVECFGTEKVRELRQTKYFAPTFRHLIFRRGQNLVSYLRIILKHTTLHGRDIIVGGIGSVATAESERGRGYAGQLLAKAMELLREAGAEIILLETNVEKGGQLYGKVGFIPANKAYAYLDINGETQAAKAKDVMIAAGTNPGLIEEIISSDSPLLDVGAGGW